MFEWIRFIIGACFLLTGIVIFGIELYGVFHYRYVLNRMHTAAIGDTLGIGVCLIGLMIISGFHFTTLKILLIIIFLWCVSPVSSHLISRLEVTTNENLDEYVEVEEK
ncbi:monovalent cation/H(+) antiporter subunit G [Lachnospiraceae bacterium JLR.KK008]